MEFNKMEALLEKYFEGETSIAEENELKDYFSSSNVAPHLEQYRPLFGYFTEAKEQKLTSEVPLVSKNRKVAWLSIAASIVVLIGVGTYTYFNSMDAAKESKELGTYDDPEEAFEATQKALAMLSDNVNVGVEGVQYLQVYEVTKDKVFVE
jgi:heme/copper-type cytochrome/quinol oxidase subunit 2